MRERPLALACITLLAAILSMLLLGGQSLFKELRPSQMEQHVKEGQIVVLTGQVYEKERTSDYQKIYLKNNSVIQSKPPDTNTTSKKSNQTDGNTETTQNIFERRLLVYDRSKTEIKIGSTLQVTGEVSFFDTARNPGNFDSRRYYQCQDIHAVIFSTSVTATDQRYNGWDERFWRLRERWKAALYGAAGEENGGILCAMILGEKSGMDEEIKELYQKNGIGHILAISGLHLSFIGVGIYGVLRRASGSYLIGGGAGILFLCAYIVMIGWSVSALRAVVMFIVRVGADMCGRVYDALTALSVAAVVVIFWRPLGYFDGGFQLSFGAVLGIVLILPVLEGEKDGKHRAVSKALSAGLSIHLAILPAILWNYFEFPVYSLLLNLAVVPVMSVILFLGICGSFLYACLPGAGILCMDVCSLLFGFYRQACQLLLELPGARIITGRPGGWQIGLYYICLLIFLVLLKGRNKDCLRKRAVNLAVLMAGLCILVGGQRISSYITDSGRLAVTMADVGQGDCIFLRAGGKLNLMVDGGSSDIKQVGKYRIEPFLKAEGVGSLDYVFVTHGDADHINGIQEMLKRRTLGIRIHYLVLPVEEVWEESLTDLAALAEKAGTRVLTIKKGQVIHTGELSVTCLYPSDDGSAKPGNSASMVLDVRFGDFDMLLTGDLEDDGEVQVTEELEQTGRKYDVLKAAHHGSRNSTKELFLQAAEPGTALISAGQNNRYGHPNKETLERLKAAGCQIYATADCGALTVETDGEKMGIRAYLE